ncbi:cytokine-inducible SH2-containing protein [Danio rerio]|uniref:Cytokine-inducible SH2-containing protein n=1 Tax=Danio rerio TaxID=7955 RepID=Q08BW5_DANRE|nr:cytokine-inducible SH2-containing protein [Danio rerio]AAI24529.1 Cytokine inducible SH2-containing protein [Danio rerio]ABM68033.1 cytokine-inducible SH2-containing protein [Danio rerio]CAJ13513.1 cytokine inducible SH2 containing protein [Danio rerio]CBY83934.1 cytokine inducible SH2-containing protein A [Danio rerio]|eukprot:NP_001070085.1 cytokine-inducible SH2-containing protein [Danio rerio]
MILCVEGPSPRALLPFSSPRRIDEPFLTIEDASKDYRALTLNFSYLDASGWYWGGISASEAHSVLKGASEGTFLIRDSSHPDYMLTLSVKTVRGPTNVRIEYRQCRFSLDSSSPARSHLQSFPDVHSLVQHYVGSKSEKNEEKMEEAHHVISSAPKECSVLLKLKKPIHCPQGFPSLKHLTRLVINKHTSSTEMLPLPNPLLYYLQNYPFQL